MNTELFFMRTLFVLVAITSVTAMSGMIRSDASSIQKLAQQHAAASTKAG